MSCEPHYGSIDQFAKAYIDLCCCPVLVANSRISVSCSLFLTRRSSRQHQQHWFRCDLIEI